MHGAGMAYLNFMRPNSSMIEIFPCNWYNERYFTVPARLGDQIIPFQIMVNSSESCEPDDIVRRGIKKGKLATKLR